MKVVAINGSPRKQWNTATLLSKALEGAADKGAETELVHLYDLEFKGCTSCFACKRKGGKSYGRCAMRDGLSPILERIREADAIVLGSPVYLSDVTGEMRSFVERLVFPYLVYDTEGSTLYPRRTRSAWIFTMGMTDALLERAGYPDLFRRHETIVSRFLGPAEPPLLVTDTCQFDDYSRYVSSRFDPEAKARRRAEAFPRDLQRAYELGTRLAAPEKGE